MAIATFDFSKEFNLKRIYMRSEVLEFFQNLPASEVEQFNKAFELYRRSPNKSDSVERQYNNSGYTKHNLGTLLYDLQKLHTIKDIEKLPVVIHPEAVFHKVEPSELEQLKAAILSDDNPYLLYFLKLAADHTEINLEHASDELVRFSENGFASLSTFRLKNQTLAAVFIALFEERDIDFLKEVTKDVVLPEAIAAEIQTLATTSVAEANSNAGASAANADEPFSLRTKYPFLNDLDCPAELKILVADKITHYKEYQRLHAELQDIADGKFPNTNPETITKLTTASVYHFEESEKITAELDHYLAEKTVLGAHPIFAQLALEREVDAMTQDELLNFKTQTASFLSKNKTKLKAAKTDERKAELEQSKADRNAKLALVNKKLGVNAG